MAKIKLKRGQKLCKECEGVNPSRQRVCKYCGVEFIRKGTKLKGEIKNWKDIEPGSLVRTVCGTGPYIIDRTGEKIYTGHNGVFRVYKVDRDGLQTFSTEGYFAYLYMGKSRRSSLSSEFVEPYRLKIEKRKKKKWR